MTRIDFTDVSDTQKVLAIEVPGEVVEQELVRLTAEYGKHAKIPGFRPGKAPASIIRRRFRDRLLQDVAQELVPRTIGDALRERKLDPLDSPNVTEMTIEEGRPLSFKASFEVAPLVDAGDLATISVREPAVSVSEEDVERALDRLREQAARFEPIEGRGAEHGDYLTIDLARRRLSEPAAPEPDRHSDVTVEVGAQGNPPGFDTHVLGQKADDVRTFVLSFPADYEVPELAGADVEYQVTVKTLRTKNLPALDDEFAKDLGQFDSLEALKGRVRDDLAQAADRDRRQQMRQQALQQLAARVTTDAPTVLVEREVERRLEEFARRLYEQGIDPTKASINWEDFRSEQRAPAIETVKSTLMLDEVARRDNVEASEDDIAAEVARYATASGRTPAAVRARLERDGALGRLAVGVRREKTLEHVMSRATIVPA